MGFYCELFDTVRLEPNEFAVASTILKLGALSNWPPVFAAIHAINSPLVLEQDEHSLFCGLVARGRIRFLHLPNGRGPREEFIERLGQEIHFHTWPETQDFRNDLWKQAKESIRSGKPRTESETLNARLGRALELFSAIDQFRRNTPELKAEEERHTEFHNAISQIPSFCLPGAEWDELRHLLTRVVALKRRGSRSEVYRAIEEDPNVSVELETQAKEVVDALFNRTVAKTLRQSFWSTRRHVRLESSLHLSSRPVELKLATSENVGEDEAAGVPRHGLRITWRDIKDVLGDIGENQNRWDNELAKAKLAEKVASRQVNVAFLPAAAGATFLINAYYPEPISAALTAVGMLFGGRLKDWATSIRIKAVEKSLSGYLDPPSDQ